MKTLNIIVHRNQNEVNKSEAEKIRRKVKKHFPEYRLKMYINEGREYAEALDGNKITFATSDKNYRVEAFIINFVEVTNTYCPEDIRTIKLN